MSFSSYSKSISCVRLGGGGGGDSHMKVTGMLVVSLRGLNCRFWSRLGFSGRKANIFTHTGIAQGYSQRNIYMKKPNAANL